MATARLSLAQAIGRPLTMTGEPTLTGHPHFSPGIAARRNRVREPILPEANKPDFHELPDDLRTGLTGHFAGNSPQVAQIAFADAAPPGAGGRYAPWPPAGPRVWICARHRPSHIETRLPLCKPHRQAEGRR